MAQDILLTFLVLFVITLIIWFVRVIIKDTKQTCSICGFQPNNGYYWIKNKRYCDTCFKKFNESSARQKEIDYLILMRLREERQRTDKEIKLLTVNREWDWLKKKEMD